MDVINAMFIGAVIGLIIALPAIYAEIFREVKDLPILVDVHACWGRVCTDREVFWLSLFVHFIFAIAFGGLYATMFFVGLARDFSFVSILFFAAVFYLFWGFLILPLLRLGIFGSREGKYVWAELLISHFLMTAGFWAAYRLFPVFLPF